MTDGIELRGLDVRLGARPLVDDVRLVVRPGELVGLVGASGSGKTMTCRALLGLVDLAPGVVRADLRIAVGGQEWRPYDGCLGANRRRRDDAFTPVRGAVLGYLPQDAPGALDPYRRVGKQVTSSAQRGARDPRPEPWLEQAGFSADDLPRVARSWPHELSGGMAQRVALAIALARGSRFLLADEPTTGLDAVLQVRSLATLRALAGQGLGVLVVTHDLDALAAVADRVVLLDKGRLAEELTPEALRAGEAQTAAGRRLVRAAFGGGAP